MKKRYINASLFILVVLIVSLGGVLIGQDIKQQYNISHSERLHQYLHDELHITSDQEKKIELLEVKYKKERIYLENIIHQADVELANAIKNDRSYSSNVKKAVDKIHLAMGELQKATLEHLFEMQKVLDEEQNAKLDQLITDALY